MYTFALIEVSFYFSSLFALCASPTQKKYSESHFGWWPLSPR